jgi:hypothetical protein
VTPQFQVRAHDIAEGIVPVIEKMTETPVAFRRHLERQDPGSMCGVSCRPSECPVWDFVNSIVRGVLRGVNPNRRPIYRIKIQGRASSIIFYRTYEAFRNHEDADFKTFEFGDLYTREMNLGHWVDHFVRRVDRATLSHDEDGVKVSGLPRNVPVAEALEILETIPNTPISRRRVDDIELMGKIILQFGVQKAYYDGMLDAHDFVDGEFVGWGEKEPEKELEAPRELAPA